ncbi:hypothetical protein GOBAR_AA12711 [Gossypium barbadense]|uniref:PAP-associated domain-containing protein n=1 Tax=Gossypium barbadense TaxID=3634 RepID=A0A2P5XXA6_GOSBA|nr:hypothetical protein GOBAR_AA12711 [Gossypium barbadense]
MVPKNVLEKVVASRSVIHANIGSAFAAEALAVYGHKGEKDWTRRIGNDRHLIYIEDPFVVSHDLGRVVDKFSIKVLREEFERVTNVMQYDPNPWITLFEPYVPRVQSYKYTSKGTKYV